MTRVFMAFLMLFAGRKGQASVPETSQPGVWSAAAAPLGVLFVASGVLFGVVQSGLLGDPDPGSADDILNLCGQVTPTLVIALIVEGRFLRARKRTTQTNWMRSGATGFGAVAAVGLAACIVGLTLDPMTSLWCSTAVSAALLLAGWFALLGVSLDLHDD